MKEHVLSLSYGKDSLACLGAIEKLGWPLDRIVHAEIWATDTIPADLPPMVEFKARADEIIKTRWGITVEHFTTKYAEGISGEKVNYEECFYRRMVKGKFVGRMGQRMEQLKTAYAVWYPKSRFFHPARNMVEL